MSKMLRSLLLFGLLFLASFSNAQKGTITGKVRDDKSGEPLVGVNILYGKGLGIITDINGKYQVQLGYGTYTLTVSYVGYESVTKNITVESPSLNIDFALQVITLSEVTVVGDVAKHRETPVAFSTITPMKMQEQLAGRDIPMLLNSTPGVYATQMGGGDGDARITIRGFSSRNVGVLLDGVPVNDMENGIVYWSNWFGLDAVTRSIQVQRGLGASKLALPSVGGTINIITKGVEERRSGILKEEFGSDGYTNTSLGFNSGKLKNGYGLTFAGSYKRGNGWVDHTWTKAYFFYFKVDKFIGKHVVSLSAYGAPQSHGQRTYNLPAAVYNLKWALDHGVDSADLSGYKAENWSGGKYKFDLGVRHNQHWGQFETYTIAENGIDTSGFGKYDSRNERVNEYFKPQFTLKDFWTVNEKLSISNILYSSIGMGGGIRAAKNLTFLSSGDWELQSIRDLNSQTPSQPGDTTFSYTLRKCISNYLVKRKNEHRWFGLLSTLNYRYSDRLTMSGGIDIRTYRGLHYAEIYDLLGADYLINGDDRSISYLLPNGKRDWKKYMKFGSDKIQYSYDGLVRWAGIFYQIEYKVKRLSAFVNTTGALSGYQRINNFLPDSVENTTPWKWINGWTVKAGANFNLTTYLSVFFNLGYLNKAPRFENVYDEENKLFREIKNEGVQAVEAGITYGSSELSVKINAYYTNWLNRPVDLAINVPSTDSLGETVIYSANINGLAALHKGIEMDFAWQPIRNLKIQGLLSLGDWKWNSADSVRLKDDYGKTKRTLYVNAKGIHVGDAAQFQVAGDIRYEPINDLYINGKITYFGKYYSKFDPMSYDQEDPKLAANFDEHGNPVDTWKIPAFYLVDFNAGYAFKVSANYRIQLRLSVLNALNAMFVADADDNSKYIGQPWNTHDARSAGVFFGLGRRYTASIAFQF